MDTLGNLLDKQLTAVMKLNATNDKESNRYQNLSMQIDRLTEEIDIISSDVLMGKIDANDSMRPQHKTY